VIYDAVKEPQKALDQIYEVY